METHQLSVLWREPIFRSVAFQSYRDRLKTAMATTQPPHEFQVQSVLPHVHEGLLGLQRSVAMNSSQLQDARQEIPNAIRNDLLQLETRLLASVIGSIDQERLHSVRSSLRNCTTTIDRLLQPIATPSVAPEQSLNSVLGQVGMAMEPPTLPYRISRSAHSITLIWQEWQEGIHGGPAVRDLESYYGSKWRSSPPDRKLFSRRKKVIDRIISESESRGCPPEEVAAEMERYMNDNSLSLTAMERQI
jgi:Transcriptional activator of glycolytic enzymes